MSKQIVNVTRIIPFFELKSGQAYYYKQGNHINQATVVFCDNCGKACAINPMIIRSFGKKTTSIALADISSDELSYCEETEDCLCSDCY
jgi:hypothetical protein